MKEIKWNFHTDIGDQLMAVEAAMDSIIDAMYEMEGIGELFDLYGELGGVMADLEAKKDEIETYITGERQQEIADMTREYYRSVI